MVQDLSAQEKMNYVIKKMFDDSVPVQMVYDSVKIQTISCHIAEVYNEQGVRYVSACVLVREREHVRVLVHVLVLARGFTSFCACVRACVRMCVRACMHAGVRAYQCKCKPLCMYACQIARM